MEMVCYKEPDKSSRKSTAKILKDIGWNDSFDDKGQILYYFEEVDLSIFK